MGMRGGAAAGGEWLCRDGTGASAGCEGVCVSTSESAAAAPRERVGAVGGRGAGGARGGRAPPCTGTGAPRVATGLCRAGLGRC
eukprot:scaffold259702_cov13-Tisochrysis_lutea.AAC.1